MTLNPKPTCFSARAHVCLCVHSVSPWQEIGSVYKRVLSSSVLLPPGQKTNNCDGNEGGNTSRFQPNSRETSAELNPHSTHFLSSEGRHCQGNIFAITRYFFASTCILSGSHKDRNSKQQWPTEPLMLRMKDRCWVKPENSDYTSFQINRRLVTEEKGEQARLCMMKSHQEIALNSSGRNKLLK